MKAKKRIFRVILGILAVAFWLLVCWLLAARINKPLLLPTPPSVLARLAELIVTAEFWSTAHPVLCAVAPLAECQRQNQRADARQHRKNGQSLESAQSGYDQAHHDHRRQTDHIEVCLPHPPLRRYRIQDHHFILHGIHKIP